ncbi:MAG: signal peptidase I [bacterium]|nr:signal peptidase I [bacterium]
MDTLKRIFAGFVEILEVATIAVVTVLLVRSFLVQPFLVNGASMEPNFSNNNYLLVDELTYRLRQPERGEVIVFRYPGDESTFYIKRMIGLSGERVQIKNGIITIFNNENPDGLILDEKYLPTGLITSGDINVTLKDDEYFVLGDNRSFSFDSRSWGILPHKDLIGVVRLRLWPVTNVSAFAAPVYQ